MWARKYVIAGVSCAVAVVGQVQAGLAEVGADSDPFAADVVPEEKLRDLRGGMDVDGLVGYFAIDRVVEVDGQVVAKMQIVVTNLDKLATGGMPTITVSGPVAELVQVMNGGAPATTAPAQSSGLSPSAAPPTAPSGAAAVTPGPPSTSTITVAQNPVTVSAPAPTATTAGASVSSAPAAAVAATGQPAASQPTAASVQASTVQANVQVVPQASAAPPAPASASAGQSAGPNVDATAGITKIIPIGSTGQVVVVSNLPNAAALTTAVQNEVRGTTIQTQTTITASLNSLTVLNGLTLASEIQQQLSLALHH